MTSHDASARRTALNRNVKHGILITVSLGATACLYYLGDLSWLGSSGLSRGFLASQAFHEICLLLLAGPVIYATIIFRIRGGVVVALVSSAIVMPHILHFSPYSDPVYRLITFLIINLLMAGVIGNQLNSRQRLERERTALQRYLSETIGVQERERRYLARELHDESLQLLVDISHHIDEIEVQDEDEKHRARLARLHQDVESVIEGIRRFIQGLRPPLLEEVGLATALRWLTEEFREETGAEVAADIPDEDVELTETAELALYRIAQEALTNVKKHSGAGKIDISLKFGGGQAQLTVTDNGRGFSAPPLDNLADQGSFGLIGMQERARLARGSLKIESAEGRGTTVSAAIPLN